MIDKLLFMLFLYGDINQPTFCQWIAVESLHKQWLDVHGQIA